MRRPTSWTLTLAVLLVALLLNGGRPSDATAAEVEELRQLYAEFLTFKNDPEFHAVGYGRCCRYYEWMKKVEALRGGHTGGFLTHFGIGPGDLIMLGGEYSHGCGHGDTARYFEALIAEKAAAGRAGQCGVIGWGLWRWGKDIEKQQRRTDEWMERFAAEAKGFAAEARAEAEASGELLRDQRDARKAPAPQE